MKTTRVVFYSNLIRQLVKSDFKLRYQGSVLGIMWSFLRPLLMFGVLYLVFSYFVRFDIPHYQLYLLLGVIIWNFFSEASLTSVFSLVNKAGLIKKVDFPKGAIVVSATLVSFLNFLLNFLVFIIIFFLSGEKISATAIWFTFLVFLLFFTALGFGFLLAALNSKWKDIGHLWELLLQMGFWLTPVVYSRNMISEAYDWIFEINPLATIIDVSRRVLIFDDAPDVNLVIKLIFQVVLVLVVGYYVFWKRQKYFAEEL
ncbi:MAG: ABC transporter permease [Anaplasmataceae bacterium]|nr:ABC transporter permease [Anaplasmataceae bacterium]